jgi:hypothetical protein
MPVPRRLTYPDPDCACAVACGVKPEPPLAVAARGLTPHATAKPRSGSDLARATIFCGSNTRAAPHDPIAQGANRTDGNLVRTRTRTLRSVIACSARRNAGNLVRVTHRGQRSFQTAQTGRIHERSRPLRRHRFCCLPNGGRPYMTIVGVTCASAIGDTRRTRGQPAPEPARRCKPSSRQIVS